jgi:hypothetical protein
MKRVQEESPIKKDYRLDLLALAVSQHYRLVKEIIENNSLAKSITTRHTRCAPPCRGEALLADKLTDLIGAIAGKKIQGECKAFFRESWMKGNAEYYNFGTLFQIISEGLPEDNDTKYDAKARIDYFRKVIRRFSEPIRSASTAPYSITDKLMPPGEDRPRPVELPEKVEVTTFTVTRKKRHNKDIDGQMLLFEETKEDQDEKTEEAMEKANKVDSKRAPDKKANASRSKSKSRVASNRRQGEGSLDSFSSLIDDIERQEREGIDYDNNEDYAYTHSSNDFDRVSEYYNYAGIEE